MIKKIFIVGASKSGKSLLINKIKDNVPLVLDEEYKTMRPLLRLAMKYYYNKNINIINDLKLLMPAKFNISANPAYFSLIGILNEIYPDSKFIYLFRNAPSQIEIWMRSKLYSIIDPYRWSRFNFDNKLTRFEKCCHFWTLTNEEIIINLKNVNSIFVKFEDLNDGLSISTISEFICHPIEKNDKYIIKVDDTPKLKKDKLNIINTICGDTINKLY
jgi:GTPase SAR1 family protein